MALILVAMSFEVGDIIWSDGIVPALPFRDVSRWGWHIKKPIINENNLVQLCHFEQWAVYFLFIFSNQVTVLYIEFNEKSFQLDLIFWTTFQHKCIIHGSFNAQHPAHSIFGWENWGYWSQLYYIDQSMRGTRSHPHLHQFGNALIDSHSIRQRSLAFVGLLLGD